MTISDELLKLRELRQSGALDDDEFAAAKTKLLNESSEAESRASVRPEVVGSSVEFLEQQSRQWGLLLHLSVLAGFAVPLAGLVAPIVIWQTKKDQMPDIDEHGKNAVNWIISEIIYAVISGLLVFVAVGIPLLIALGVVGIVFPIMAGLKANEGEVWRYPMSIEFFK